MGLGEDDRNRLGYGPEGYLTLSGGAAETEMKVEVKGPKEGPYPNARSVDNEDGNGGLMYFLKNGSGPI
ncbi:hypothetical protein G6F43_013863 [Rhizopus delemar]|nr:hypothetical protein G6F43_013863 [Rhizopus delemar]